MFARLIGQLRRIADGRIAWAFWGEKPNHLQDTLGQHYCQLSVLLITTIPTSRKLKFVVVFGG